MPVVYGNVAGVERRRRQPDVKVERFCPSCRRHLPAEGFAEGSRVCLECERAEEARRGRPPMSVRCAETGEVFPSVLAASRALGLSESDRAHVYRAAANPERTSGGFHWEVAGARALAV